MTAVSQGFRPARVALLGCGTVGREVAARLTTEGRRLGVELVGVLVRDGARERGLRAGLATERFDDILAAEPDAIVEAIGGVEAPAAYISRALSRAIPVVTANKSLVAHHGAELVALADRAGTELAFEATVCAGVPVLAALRQLEGDRVRVIRGLVSGTCNFILSRLEAGHAYADALAEAQGRGLAEPDPTADVSGRDCAEKVAVLALAAGLGRLDPGAIPREGIERITPDDLTRARRSGLALRLVSELEVTERGLHARVGPALLARRHALAGLEGEETGVEIVAELAGPVVLRGPGAGPRPTASAILGDLARVLAGRHGAGVHAGVRAAPPVAHLADDRVRSYSVRVRSAGLQPERVLEPAERRGIDVRELVIERHLGVARVTGRGDDVPAWSGTIARGEDTVVLPILD